MPRPSAPPLRTSTANRFQPFLDGGASDDDDDDDSARAGSGAGARPSTPPDDARSLIEAARRELHSTLGEPIERLKPERRALAEEACRRSAEFFRRAHENLRSAAEAERGEARLARDIDAVHCRIFLAEALMRLSYVLVAGESYAGVVPGFFEPALRCAIGAREEADAAFAHALNESESLELFENMRVSARAAAVFAELAGEVTRVVDDARAQIACLEQRRERLVAKLAQSRGERDVVRARIGESRWNAMRTVSSYAERRAALAKHLGEIEACLAGMHAHGETITQLSTAEVRLRRTSPHPRILCPRPRRHPRPRPHPWLGRPSTSLAVARKSRLLSAYY